MRVTVIGFIISQIIVPSPAGKSRLPTSHGTATRFQREILLASESRYHLSPDYPHNEYSNYNSGGVRRNEFDSLVNFNVPSYEAHDHWRQNSHNRRTFFQDFPYGSTTPFPTFYQFMTSLFGGRDSNERKPSDKFHHDRIRPTSPYPFEHPYSFRPTEPNYIPPPKPIRASVIKLESITRPPIYASFEDDSTTKYYHNVGTILNHVLIENSKMRQHLDYHPYETIPPFKPLPVLPKPPGYVIPTTIMPRFFKNQTFDRYNHTDYKYPDSVQDQLPHLQMDNVKIPYVSEKPIPQIFDALPTEISSAGRFGHSAGSKSSATTNILGLIDIRSLNSTERGTRVDLFDATTIRSFPGAVEKVERPTLKFRKKVSTHADRISVERVTNLTVQGLSQVGKEAADRPKYVNHINYNKVKDFINREMAKLGNISHSSNSSSRHVNLNDELSLDAKILKDTNWDGLIVEMSTTTEARKETSTEIPKTSKTAFWEIVDGWSTTAPTTETAKTTITTTTTTIIPVDTTTEFTRWSSPETTNDPTTTTPPSLFVAQRRSQSQTVTPEPDTLDTTRSGRRYNRRPKIVNFTPYPTTEELQKKLLNRNYFAKRQKPNITLAFGNKNVLKNRQSFGKDEVMKFSDEDVRKRRKIGKRRQVYKRVRVSSSERPIQDELQ